MKAFLMYKDCDFDLHGDLLPNAADLTQDLELDILFNAMSAGDEYLRDVAKKSILVSLHDPEAILYRQQILAECLEWPSVVREVYGIAVEAIQRERRIWGWPSSENPVERFDRSIEALQLFVELFHKLRKIIDEHGFKFRSEGLSRLISMFRKELDDGYLQSVEKHLKRLEFHNGISMSAEIDNGGKGTNYILHRPQETPQNWVEKLQFWMGQLTRRTGGRYVYELNDRDEAGFKAFWDLRKQGLRQVAVALAQSTDHILNFFKMLRLELGFYMGCLNLRERLEQKQEPFCLPEPLSAEWPNFSCQGLYDICLSLTIKDRVVGNDVTAMDKKLVMITGANRGGKSTFLRSVGIAQLMMQCGMFVPAKLFRANVSHGIFTHFKREEDASMKSGKLDEELSRMSAIVDKIAPRSIALLNESFASTNEREGSEIARQIVRALLEMEIKVLYVTHMFDLSHGFYVTKMESALFLRAERLADGTRTFRLLEGEPLPTSYGQDLYQRIFSVVGDVTAAESLSK